VVFDIGGVLVVAGSAALAVAPSVGVDPRLFDDAYWHHRPAFDLGGLSPAEYCGAVAADVGLALSPEQVEQYDQVDATRWAQLSPGRAELRERGWRAHVWENPERCRVALRQLGVLDA